MTDKIKQVSVPINHNTWIELLKIKKRTGNSLVSIIRTAIDIYLKLQKDSKSDN